MSLLGTSLVTSIGSVAGPGMAAPTRELSSSVATSTSQVSFSQALDQVTADAMDTMKKGEAAAIQGLSGKASVQQVAEAVMSAERTLQTTLALRDKAVSAYQEISKMTI